MTTMFPEFCDLTIFVDDRRQTTDRPITLPLTHARGVTTLMPGLAILVTTTDNRQQTTNNRQTDYFTPAAHARGVISIMIETVHEWTLMSLRHFESNPHSLVVCHYKLELCDLL